MEEKINVVKQQLIELKYQSYADEFDDGSRVVGFLECARIFITQEDIEECNSIAWQRYMEDEGYTADQADEIYKDTLATIQAGIDYLKTNPNAKLSDL